MNHLKMVAWFEVVSLSPGVCFKFQESHLPKFAAAGSCEQQICFTA